MKMVGHIISLACHKPLLQSSFTTTVGFTVVNNDCGEGSNEKNEGNGMDGWFWETAQLRRLSDR